MIRERHYSQLFVIVDENTEQHCLPLLQEKTGLDNLQRIRISAGELHKNIDTCQFIWRSMMQANADRKALTINLGGGVIGDMGGFCAATFKRGMDFVQVPTTLLSQVDASIGGKLGIDFQDVKNSVGLFANPQAVFIDPSFLQTLSQREVRSGFAEIIKHALIADLDQWKTLLAQPDLSAIDWSALIVPSLKIKQKIVEQDPFERGLRKALNFGHTIGHAVESHALTSPEPLLHGEAIAIGMIAELYLSHQQLGLPMASTRQATQFLLSRYDRYIPDADATQRLIALMYNDKKNEGGQINFSLLPQLGQVEVNQACSEASIADALRYYREACQGFDE